MLITPAYTHVFDLLGLDEFSDAPLCIVRKPSDLVSKARRNVWHETCLSWAEFGNNLRKGYQRTFKLTRKIVSVRLKSYDIARIDCLHLIPPAERVQLLTDFDRITNTIWVKPAHYFEEKGNFLFRPDASLYLATENSVTIGFSVTLNFKIGDRSVLFRWFTNILPSHQGKGIATAISRHAIERAFPIDAPLYYGFRTRNPARWRLAMKYLSRIAPNLTSAQNDPDLMQLAHSIAHHVYPGSAINSETMEIMDAYEAGSGYRAECPDRHRGDSDVFEAQSAIKHPQGAILFAGICKPLDALQA